MATIHTHQEMLDAYYQTPQGKKKKAKMDADAEDNKKRDDNRKKQKELSNDIDSYPAENSLELADFGNTGGSAVGRKLLQVRNRNAKNLGGWEGLKPGGSVIASKMHKLRNK